MKNPITPIKNTNDLKIRIFRILAFGGFFVSAFIGTTNLIIGLPLENALICWATALLSLVLILYANRTGRYRLCVNITIIFIFLGVFTLLFVEGGGYKSGMPLYFIMAVVFTAFMVEGREMYAFIALELCWYSALCIYAYRHPESIRVLENEGSLVMDILIALPVVSIILTTTMFLQLRLIRRNQTELEQARKEALSASEAKTAFLANMMAQFRSDREISEMLNISMPYAKKLVGIVKEKLELEKRGDIRRYIRK